MPEVRKYSWVASDTKGEFRVRTLEGLYHIRLSHEVVTENQARF